MIQFKLLNDWMLRTEMHLGSCNSISRFLCPQTWTYDSVSKNQRFSNTAVHLSSTTWRAPTVRKCRKWTRNDFYQIPTIPKRLEMFPVWTGRWWRCQCVCVFKEPTCCVDNVVAGSLVGSPSLAAVLPNSRHPGALWDSGLGSLDFLVNRLLKERQTEWVSSLLLLVCL